MFEITIRFVTSLPHDWPGIFASMPHLHKWIVPKLGAEGQYVLAADDVVAKLIH